MNTINLYLIFMCLWIAMANVWHAALLLGHKLGVRPSTISEHAAKNKQLLLVHRIVHSLPLLVFTPVVFKYLLPNGYNIAAGLLISAAIFDCLETITLNERTASPISWHNTHHITAWMMAISYCLYSLIISRIAGLSDWVYGPILLTCVLLVVFAKKGISKKKSLTMQMIYFALVSFVGVLANIKLILS